MNDTLSHTPQNTDSIKPNGGTIAIYVIFIIVSIPLCVSIFWHCISGESPRRTWHRWQEEKQRRLEWEKQRAQGDSHPGNHDANGDIV